MSEASVKLLQGERIDQLMRGGLMIIQNPSLFCFGTDAVLLAHFAAQEGAEQVCDLGTGVGILPLLMSERMPRAQFDALDIQETLCDMAQRSVQMNGLQERIQVHHADLRGAHRLLGANRYDCVVCNPPYAKAGTATPSDTAAVRIAKHEVHGSLDDILRSANQLLKHGARLCMVYRAERMGELLSQMAAHHLAPKRLCAVHDSVDSVAKLVLVQARKGAGDGLVWLPPLILKDEDGEASRAYRHIYALP